MLTPKAKAPKKIQKPKLTKKAAPLRPLEKGQLWKVQDTFVEILELGKTLARYRHYKSQVRVPSSLATIETLQKSLKQKKAKLIPNPRLASKKPAKV